MLSFLSNLSNVEIIFLIIGFTGQGVFASRFIVQWIYSEQKGESVVPVIFWYLSIVGGLGLLTYSIFIGFIFSASTIWNSNLMFLQSFAWIIGVVAASLVYYLLVKD